MAYILGFDGGATKSIAMILDTDSGKKTEEMSGPTNFRANGLEETKKNIVKPVSGLVNKIKDNSGKRDILFQSACFGFSGCDVDEDYQVYKDMLFQSEIGDLLDPDHTIVLNDVIIGLAAASQNKNRMILNCGTGSICYGENASGEKTRVNGWDYILGDEGSGYSISIRALRAVMQAFDGRGEKTCLSGMVLKSLGLDSEEDLVNWAYDKKTSKEDIASISMDVCKAAGEGDNVSIKILKDESLEAFKNVSAAVNKLDLGDKCFDLVLTGSIFKCEKYFREQLLTELKNKYKKINIKEFVNKPVLGAINIALEGLSIRIS
jgi:N-acetylglucosamine kinase-like BadF-type ATPase